MSHDSRTWSRDELLRWLRWQVEMGADEAIAATPLDRLAASGRPSASPAAASAAIGDASAAVVRPASASRPAATTVPSPPSAAARTPEDCHTLEEVRAALDAMHHFPLRRTARHTVFTDGNPQAKILLIGEAPGREEDLTGKPFVGRAGQLLDRMLAAIGLDRHADDPDRAVLITNVLFWRPPGNRSPTEAELSFCAPWVLRTIAIVQPRVVVTLGGPATQRLTGNPQGITRQRGKWTHITVPGLEQPLPLLPMLHPAFLLRAPVQKRLAWRDLLALKLFLEEQEK